MFKKALRRKAKLKIALAGPSGSGKTASALLIAKGLGGKIAVIDTENDSASLYAEQEIGGQKMPDFDSLNLKPPYTSKAYLTAMQEAVKGGYDVLIIDSVSHQWAGEGGVLRRKETLDQKPGSNSWTNWGTFTPEQESFTTSLLQFPLHLIVTMRSKQEYALVQQDGKKAKVEKLGMAPVQRDGMEYEFTSFIDIDITHQATSSKDRTGIFEGKYFKITEETGKALAEWLNAGTENAETGVSLDTLQQGSAVIGQRPPNASQPQPRSQQQAQPIKPKPDPNRPLTVEEFNNIHSTALKHLWTEEEFVLYMRRKYKTILAQKLTLQNGMDFHKVIVSMTGAQALQTVPAEKPPADFIKPVTPQPSQSVPNEANGSLEANIPPPEETPPYPDFEGGDPIIPGDQDQGSFANFIPGGPTA